MTAWQCGTQGASPTCTGDTAFDTAHAAVTTGDDVSGDDQRFTAATEPKPKGNSPARSGGSDRQRPCPEDLQR
jgi:hypothetical protein